MRSYAFLPVCLTLLLLACSPQKKGPDTSFAGQVRGLVEKEGFFDLYIDERRARVLARLPKPNEDGVSLRFIHANSLNAGLGSNPVGLDRGLTTSGQIVAFRKIGNKIIAEAENWKYRASADNPYEKESVRASFAKSYLWSGKILSRAGNGDLLVDLSDFLTQDLMNIRGQLRRQGQGSYAIASERSFPETATALAFPDNVELNAAITFTNGTAGSEVARTAANGRAFTLSLHHSFVRLPDEGYETRDYDPRVAAIDVPFYDYSTRIDQPITRSYARRFRLQREEPAVAKGPVKKPIVFYVDPGAPEPIRSALIDGASWWAEAFEEAGFENAFRVEVLPEGAHPLDIRYNIIQWTHRQTRGWSYGGGINDPRTGEMLKAHVILGSQRVRQDRMIFEGLTSTSASGTGNENDPIALSLARIRQLSAHEVGHTLGFAHNFAASTNDRSSVMDYPAPYVRLNANGGFDFSNTYDTGIGEWDKFTVRWLYGQFAPEANEKRILNNMIEEIYDAGFRFVSDAHSRNPAASHAYGSLWDNGANPVETLDETMRVRRLALRNFDLQVAREGEPRARIREVLVPIYLYHRYQVEAAAKFLGGVNFNYSVLGDGLSFAGKVSAEDQRLAIAALLRTLDPKELDLPDRLLIRLTPPVGRYGGNSAGENFPSDLGAIFDPLKAADTAASVTLSALLQPARLARLHEQHRIDSDMPDVEELLAALEIALFSDIDSERQAAIARRLQYRFVMMLSDTSRNRNTSPAVRAELDAYLDTLQTKLSSGLSSNNRDPKSNHQAYLLNIISRLINRNNAWEEIDDYPLSIPQGSPIGARSSDPDSALPPRAIREECWHCDSIELMERLKYQ